MRNLAVAHRSYGNPCSKAPFTDASSAFSRYSASASGDPKRRPGAGSGPWCVRTQWASCSRRSSANPSARYSSSRCPSTMCPSRRPSSVNPISAP